MALSFNEFIDNILNACVYALIIKFLQDCIDHDLSRRLEYISIGLYNVIECMCGLGWDFIIYSFMHYFTYIRGGGGAIAANIEGGDTRECLTLVLMI